MKGIYTRQSVLDRIRAGLAEAGAAGLTRSQISGLLSRRQPHIAIVAALYALRDAGEARYEIIMATGGRPAEVWFAANIPQGAA